MAEYQPQEIAKITGNRIDMISATSFRINAEYHISKTFNKAVVYAIIPANDFCSNGSTKMWCFLSKFQTNPATIYLQAFIFFIKCAHLDTFIKLRFIAYGGVRMEAVALLHGLVQLALKEQLDACANGGKG